MNLNAAQTIRITNLNIFSNFMCNLNCSYCLHKNENVFNKDHFKNESLSMENIYNLIKFIEDYRHPDLRLNILINGGEPTLNWQYFNDMTLMLRSIPNINLFIVSNFTSDYTKEQMLFIAQNYDILSVSIDGKEEINDMNRGKGSFNKAIDNAITYNSLFPGRLEINLTVTENNVEFFYENKKFFDMMRIKNTYTIDIFNIKKDKKKFVQTLLKQFGKVVLDRKSADFLSYKDNDSHCIDKYKNMTVFPNGKISHCVAIYDENLVYYDLNKYPDSKINEEVFNNIPSIGYYDDVCLQCNAKNFCRNGCYASFLMKDNRDVHCSIMAGFAIIKNEIKQIRSVK